MANKKPTYKAPEVAETVEVETTECFETSCEDCDCKETEAPAEITLPEALEAPSEATTPQAKAKTYTAKDGDSYATIAELYPVEGMTKHERSLQIWRDNGGIRLKDGTVVNL